MCMFKVAIIVCTSGCDLWFSGTVGNKLRCRFFSCLVSVKIARFKPMEQIEKDVAPSQDAFAYVNGLEA